MEKTEPEIPAKWNGAPTKYEPFDGFTQASTPMKFVYVLGFPAASIIMEGYRYNKAQHNATDAKEALSKQGAQGNGQAMADSAPETGTRFQEALNSPSESPARAR